MAIYHMMSEADVETALGFPWTSIGSDAGAALSPGGQDPTGLTHPRAYGNFPRVIARYVRERGVLTLEQAIRKMTSWPATRMRLADRGAIREGCWADVVIFDFERLQDRATYEQPLLWTGGHRLRARQRPDRDRSRPAHRGAPGEGHPRARPGLDAVASQCPPKTWKPRLRRLSASVTSISTAFS